MDYTSPLTFAITQLPENTIILTPQNVKVFVLLYWTYPLNTLLFIEIRYTTGG